MLSNLIKSLPHRHLNPALKDPLYLILGYTAAVLYMLDFVERATR